MINLKKALSLLLVGVLSVSVLAGCGKKKPVEPEEVHYELTPLTAEQLKEGKYYVKNGDTFYELPKGQRNFEDRNSVVKGSDSLTDTSRVVWFGADDVLVPTLYADDTLVYVSSSLPDSFIWERYKDNGYTVGLTGLKPNNTGSYSVKMEGVNFYPDSSMKKAVANSSAEAGSTLVFDKVDGNKINNGNVTEVGTISGLQAGKTYNFDVYVGSTYIQLTDIEADTHAFSSIEMYTSSICNYMQTNYVQVVVPDSFVSGYYLINGVGFVKYVDNARSAGIADVDFNRPYFFKDADGRLHTIDELDDGGEVIVKDEKYYSSVTKIDCTNNSMEVKVSYEDAKGINLDGSEFTYSDEEIGLPRVLLIDPDGNEYENFTSSKGEFTIKINNPIPGNWETRVYNAQKRIFNIATEFVSGHNNSLIHNGGKGVIAYYIPESMQNAQFVITWENTTVRPSDNNGVVIKDNKSNDVNHETELTFTRDSITVADEANYKESHGEIRMTVGAVKYGEYSVILDSPNALGRVRVSVIELGQAVPEEPVVDETVTEEVTEETAEVTE